MKIKAIIRVYNGMIKPLVWKQEIKYQGITFHVEITQEDAKRIMGFGEWKEIETIEPFYTYYQLKK